MRVLITGACGICGTALRSLPGEKVFFDRGEPVEALAGEPFVRGDLADLDAVVEAMRGCDAVVHAAASSRTWHNWELVLRNNIQGVRNVMEAARIVGADPVILLSSNHVVGMYELENAPQIYEIGHPVVIDHTARVRPDSYYGISKAIGEDLARVCSENGGPRCYAIRLGAVRSAADDHPYAYAEEGVRQGKWERSSREYQLQEKRLKALWLSRRDFVQLVTNALNYEGPSFDVFYGVSDNPRRWLDIERARDLLGYRPQDNAEAWTGPPREDTALQRDDEVPTQPAYCAT